MTFEPSAEWSLVPVHIRDGIRDYVEHHRRQGDFLMSLFSNDLHQTVGRADDINMASLREIVRFVWMYVPASCWGSPEKVNAWLVEQDR